MIRSQQGRGGREREGGLARLESWLLCYLRSHNTDASAVDPNSDNQHTLEYVLEYAPRNMILIKQYISILGYVPRFVLEYVPFS